MNPPPRTSKNSTNTRISFLPSVRAPSTADPFHNVTKCSTVSKQTAADLRRRSGACPSESNLYGEDGDNSNNPDYKLESRPDRQTRNAWSRHSAATPFMCGNMESCLATCNMFPAHQFPAVNTRAGLPSVTLLAQLDNNGQFVQLATQCRGLGNFGPDLTEIARDILNDPHHALGDVPCTALVYETVLTKQRDRVLETASLLYHYTDAKGQKFYCIAKSPRRTAARHLFDLIEPNCQSSYKQWDRLNELDPLMLVSYALYCICRQPLVNLYTALELYEKTKIISTRQDDEWQEALKTNQDRYSTTIAQQQELHRETIRLLHSVQRIHVSIGRGHGRFKVALCAFTGRNAIIGERPGLLPDATLAKLCRTLHHQACRTLLVTPPLDDDALWISEDRPELSYKSPESRPLTQIIVQLVNTMAAEEQITLENARLLSIPDRMRAANIFTMFDPHLPWTQQNPSAREYMDDKYDRIAGLCFSIGKDAWVGKFEGDPDKTIEDGDPDKPKRKKESTLTVHNIISMTRHKGLHLLNHHLMKHGCTQRPKLLREIAPFHFQRAWYTQAEKYCKAWRGGTTKQALNPHIVMQDCAVVAVYVTYAVGLWLMKGTANDRQAWSNLLLKWHLECLNTNKKADTSQTTATTETTQTKKRKQSNPNNPTGKKRSQKPNTTTQKLLHETIELPNDANKPIKDIRVTVEELSCEFVVLLLKELWFPVCAVVEAIRNIPMRAGPADTRDIEDNLKHKHPWAEQIIIARLLSHMITLRNDEDYQDGVKIASPSPTPLHEVMTQLSYLLEQGRITVYLPELRHPAAERLIRNTYHYYPEPRLRIQDFRIQFAPHPDAEIPAANTTEPATTRARKKQAAQAHAIAIEPLTFPEILEHCKQCQQDRITSVWTDMLQASAPVAAIPKSKRSRGKKKSNKGGSDDNEQEEQDEPRVTPPEEVHIPTEETEISAALEGLHHELDKRGDSGGTYFQILANAFGSSHQAAQVKGYLRRVLDANTPTNNNSNSANARERSASSDDDDGDDNAE